VQEIAAMLKALHANKDLAAARKKANRVKLPAAAEVARRHDVHARPVDTDARPGRLRQASIELSSCLSPTLSGAKQHFFELNNTVATFFA
jgi:hypothetical protein